MILLIPFAFALRLPSLLCNGDGWRACLKMSTRSEELEGGDGRFFAQDMKILRDFWKKKVFFFNDCTF